MSVPEESKLYVRSQTGRWEAVGEQDESVQSMTVRSLSVSMTTKRRHIAHGFCFGWPDEDRTQFLAH